jgi:hypothetical protein
MILCREQEPVTLSDTLYLSGAGKLACEAPSAPPNRFASPVDT